MATLEEDEEAARIDRLADGQLRQAKLRSNKPMATVESIRAGEIDMQHGQKAHDAAVLKRIESKALLTAGELEDAWKAPPESLRAALRDQRLLRLKALPAALTSRRFTLSLKSMTLALLAVCHKR